MEYISAEEFLRQPIEVQKMFLDWWKCDFGDLYVDKKEYEIDKDSCDINCVNMNLEGDIEGDWEYFKATSTPILSEGQLRQFIEDKLQSKLDIIYVSKELVENEESYYRIERSYFKDDMSNFFNTETDNLLQAYWKVAIEIAKEKVQK